MKAYKIVRKDEDGRLLSMVKMPEDMEVEYILGEKALPKIEGSFLMAFDIVPTRIIWNWNHELWECEVERTILNKRMGYLLNPFFNKYFQKANCHNLWNANKNICGPGRIKVPPHTIFCKSIALVRKLR